MKKVFGFFRKHKIITILSALVLLAAVSLTAVTIALWDEEKEEDIIYNIPTNPAEKYLEYYAMTPNSASESGYDYYPLTRIPKDLKSNVCGLAVARYDGYLSEVEIPKMVSVDGFDEALPVLHILANYKDNINNGFVGKVSSVILPDTITYIESGALSEISVYVKGGFSYTYKQILVEDEYIPVYSGDVQVDTLVRKNGYYYSTTTLDAFKINDGRIVYTSKYANVKFDASVLELDTTTLCDRIYIGSDNGNITYENEELRKNSISYSLDYNDLFGNMSGFMYGSNYDYYTYVVVGGSQRTFTVGEESILLAPGAKYKVTYDDYNKELEAVEVSYKIGDSKLLLDTDFNDYERYISNGKLTIEASSIVREYVGNAITNESILDNEAGTYDVTFAANTVYTDIEDVTNYSLNDDYYLLPLESSTTSHSVVVEKRENVIKEYHATSFSDGLVSGLVANEYYLAFKLPESDCIYYADFGSGLIRLTYLDGLYVTSTSSSNKVKILGYKNEVQVYESFEFNYRYGYIYDLSETSGFELENYIVVTKDYTTNNSEFGILLDSRLGLDSVNVTFEAEYYDTFNDYKLCTPSPITITKNVVDGKVLVSKDDFPNTPEASILKNATILTNEYDFLRYVIKVNGITVYSYTDDYYSMLEFYGRFYQISYLTERMISGSVVFNCDALNLTNCSVSINDNELTINETVYSYNSGAVKMERNYANTYDKEYFVEVENSGWYVISSSNSFENRDNSSYIYAEDAGLVYYSESGYKENKYSVYTLDHTFVTNMVYQNGSGYALLPTFNGPFGYYVLDEAGNEVARYVSTEGYQSAIFDAMIGDIPLLTTETGYVADNVYLEVGNYLTPNGELEITEAGYYDIRDFGLSVSATASKKYEHSYSIKVGNESYDLYPTLNPSIQVAHIYDVADDSQIFLYDERGLIITTYTLNKGGSYKLYVNVSNYNVATDKGWINNYFNFVSVKDLSTFKLVEYGPTKKLEIVSASINSSNTTKFSSNSKFEEEVYSTTQGLFHHLSDGMYVGLINGWGKYDLIGSQLEINLPVSGTYLVYTDGLMLDISRVEGTKQYYISFDGVNYQKMQLNISNNNYEEFIITNYSLSTNITKVWIKDDLDNINEFDASLSAGLYSNITFALDNRRRENGYDVFVNISGNRLSDDETKAIKLDNGEEVINYYVLNSDTKLPEYGSVFNQADHQRFIGWYTDDAYTSLYDGNGLVDGATYYAYVVNGLAYIYVSQSSLYQIVDINGNAVRTFTYTDDTEISFRVNVADGQTIKEVNINGEILTPVDGVYTFNTNAVIPPATINVSLLQPSVKVTLNAKDDSKFKDYDYEVGTYDTLPLPNANLVNANVNFMYYYDKTTGIVYTDNTGRLISPYLITSPITLTAAYSTSYYVTVNKVMPDGSITTISSEVYGSGANVIKEFIRIDGYHYSDIVALMTTNGYPVEYHINEYLHNYSFTMPSSNVVININYVENTISSVDTANEITKTIYVLVPSVMAHDVKIFDASLGDYALMTKEIDSKQIYPNYVVYKYELNTDVTKFKVSADIFESYVYTLDNENDVYIIDNLGLENEVCHLSKWVNYTKVGNVYTFDTEFSSVHMIHGNVSVDNENNTVTITEAITIATHDNYQYASFEVIYVENDVKMSYIVHYTATGEADNPVIISDDTSFKEFVGNAKFRYKSGVHFVQTADITVEDSNGYKVVYNQEKPFEHTYDGGGYTIRYVQSEIRNDVNNGLFGYIGASGVVKNFVLDYELTDANNNYGYETKYYLGSVCSINLGKISHVETTAYTLSCNNVRYVGGLVAHNVGTIEYCTNNITIKAYNHGPAESRIVGGIVGFNGGYGSSNITYIPAKILNCVNNGTIILDGETGREQYFDEIAGMNKGTISNTYSTYNKDLTKNQTDNYQLYVNGNKVPLYQTALNDDNRVVEQYMVNALTLKKGDVVTMTKNGSAVKFIGEVDGTAGKNSLSKQDEDHSIIVNTDVTADIYYKEYNENNTYYWNEVWFATDYAQYSVQITNAKGETRQFVLTPNFDKNDAHKKEFATFSLSLVAGDVVSLYRNNSKQTIKSRTSESVIPSSAISGGNIVVTDATSGVYDVYFNVSNLSNIVVHVGNDSCGPQAVENNSVTVAVVDDWYFVDELRNTGYGTYHFEAAMHVEYFDASGNSLGTMIYNNAQTYEHNGLNSVKVDVLEGATQIEICRVMLISSHKTGENMWYYSFDGSHFTKIGEALTSYPINNSKTNKTYSTGKIKLITIANNDNIIYLYATKSGKRYETTDASVTAMSYILGEVEASSYIDVEYSTEQTLGTYRVKYYATVSGKETLVALRSYKDSEQVEFLAGIDKMVFESIEEGSGIRYICEIVPDSNKTVIEFAPIIYSSNAGTPSDYKVLVNKTTSETYINPNNKDEVMITSLSLKANDMVRIADKAGSAINVSNFDQYSTSHVKFENGTITATTNGLYDIYYNFKTNKVFISEAVVYEVVTFNGSKEEGSYVMYPNPSAVHPGEVMTIGIVISDGMTAKVRRVGGAEYLNIILDSTDSTISGNTISFNKGANYDFFLYQTDAGINVYVGVGDSNKPNFQAIYPESETRSVVEFETNNLPTINFVNDIAKYNEGYTTRVYYLDNKGNVIVDENDNAYVYEFSGDTLIPILEDAYKLRILRYKNGTNIEINDVIVNAIYEGKTLTLSSPYYGYYDISYSSSIEDQTGLFIENESNANYAQLNYVLNDGRIGHIQMELNEGKWYVPFDSVIGLNPAKISFTVGINSTNFIDLQYVKGDTLYTVVENDAIILGTYSTFNRVNLFVDTELAEWDNYFILSNGVYYEMTKANIYTINGINYVLYVAYVKGDTYQVASNPSYSSVFTTDKFSESTIYMDELENGFEFRTIYDTLIEEKEYDYVADSKVFTANNETKSLAGVEWMLTGEGDFSSGNWTYNADKGMPFGTASNYFTTMNLTSTTSFTDIRSITINTSGTTNTEAVLSVYVGDVRIDDAVTITKDASEYTFTSSTPLEGAITINYTQSVGATIYIKEIKFAYKEIGENVDVCINNYTYEYYLQSDTPGLLPTIGLVESNNAYFGFYDLAEEVTYYVVDSTTSSYPLSNKITTAAGRHVIIYYEQTNKSFNYVFTSSNGIVYGNNDLDGHTWHIDGDSTANIQMDGSDGERGVKFGSDVSPEASLILTSELFENVNKVVVNTSGAVGIDATLKVYVGNTQIGEVYELTEQATDVVFTTNEALNGRVRLVYSQESEVAIFIKSIAVNPEVVDEGKTSDYYYQFSSGVFKDDVQEAALGDYTWTLSGNLVDPEATSDYEYSNANGQKFGKADNSYNTLKLTTTESVANVTKIVVNASGANDVDATLKVSVDGIVLGIVKLSNQATEYAFISNDPISGLVEIIYDQTSQKALYLKSICINPSVNNMDVYRNELAYTVNAFFNGYKDRTVYMMGEIVKSPATPQIASTAKYDFEFKGWKYNGYTYLVEEGTNYLYREADNGEKIYLYCVSAMTITPEYAAHIKKFDITLMNMDGTIEVKEDAYSYGQKISSVDFATPAYPKIDGKTYNSTNSKFMGWYIDSDKRIVAKNYAILADTILYGKWNIYGTFLVGRIEGYTDWDDQKEGYMFKDLGTTGTNHFVLEDVYLEQGDNVKIREFKITQNDYWFQDWKSYEGGSYVDNNDNNLIITKSGYYSFYIQNVTTENGKTVQNIYVTYKEYMVSYEFDKDKDLVPGTDHTYPHYRFNLPYEANGNTYQKFPIISEEDNRISKATTGKELTVNSPSLQQKIDGKTYVVKGWYTHPVNGERVTEIDSSMLVYRNSITLYPVYILGGYYTMVDGEETYLPTTRSDDYNSLPKYKVDQKISINYYNGSVNSLDGLSILDPSKVDLSETTATISGKDIVINQDGIYDIYQDENGVLHIVQYHEIVYRYNIRISPQIDGNTIRPNVIYIQKYGAPLATVDNPNIENANGVRLVFMGWTKEGFNNKPDANNQKVEGDITYDVVYRIDNYNDNK